MKSKKYQKWFLLACVMSLLIIVGLFAFRSETVPPAHLPAETASVKEVLAEKLSSDEVEQQLPKLSLPTRVIKGEIRAGEPLYVSLRRNGIPSSKILALEESMRSVFNLKRGRPGDKYEITFYGCGDFKSFKYQVSLTQIYLVEKSEDGELVASKQEVSLDKHMVGIRGEIESSLYKAMKRENLAPEMVVRFANIFAWQIDFFSETRPGDIFTIVWERYYKDDIPIRQGRILSAQYQRGERTYTAIFFECPAGSKGYYTPQGESLKKKFLRSPLNYYRISSHFSPRRFHPVLGIYRPHPATDFAAPTGTPIMAVGDGVVTHAGWRGDYGHFVEIRHSREFTTTYGHLSRYGKGIRKGVRVEQGQIIGYVGSTGLSTGPHLSFGVRQWGRPVNFLTLDFPAAESVRPDYMSDFNRVKERQLTYINALEGLTSSKLVYLPLRADKVAHLPDNQ
ncbi:MAG: peptidoglycan DD-metalloendopeptidase family protein [Thermodesulfovibrionales bacterium]|nr:peptidoglycan DD-metalloendopeptidase family protein [Thermodesulfovibrionales bacterium]